MLLRRIEVRDFGCIGRARVRLGGGLNVLYGPNDLGKSTLASAIRAALLLQHNSSGAREFVPWGTERKPEVLLEFEIDGRVWRVEKRFGYPSGGSAKLSWSNDGETFTQQEEGRAVDGHIRTLLQWGIAAPGGRGGKHGLPTSFLASVLLGEQAVPYRLFETSLGGDADDSGKDRLAEALSALATDPLYQDVLTAVQGRVDEAFTAKGKPRSGKASPFAKVAAEIKVRRGSLEDLERQVEQTDVVVSRLSELHTLADRRMGDLAAAKEGLEHAELDRKRAADRAALAEEVERTRGQLDTLERNKAEVDRLGNERREIAAELPKAETALETAAAAKEAATKALSQLGDGDRDGDDSVDTAAALAVERSEAALRDAQAQRAEAEAAHRALEEWSTTNVEVAEQRTAFEAAEAKLAELQRVVEAAEAEANAVAEAIRWRRRADAEQQVHGLEAKLADFDQSLARADTLEAEAAQLRREVEAEALPSATDLTRFRELGKSLAVAEAKLGGGVWLDAALHESVSASVAVDGGAAQPLVSGSPLEGNAQLRVDLGERGHLLFGGGSAEAASDAKAVRAQWETEVGAVLERLDAADLAAVEQRLHDAEQRLATAKGKEEEAKTQRRLAAGRKDTEAALQDARGELDRAAEACGDLDEGRAKTRAADLSSAELDDARRAADASLERHRDDRRGRRDEIGEVRARLEVAKERAAAALRGLTPDGEAADPEALASAIEARRGATEQAVEAAKEALDEAVAGAASKAEHLRAAREAAREAVEGATASHDEAATRVRELRDTAAKAEAALDVRREQLQGTDAMALAETFARLSDALAAAPEPTEPLTEERFETLQAASRDAELAADEASAEVRKQEGALAHVGGQVVRENAERAREALDAAVRREAEVELDYRAWKLLLETLREAENEEGTHLGRALADEIGERFAALTDGRYGGLELGPELEAKGLLTSAGEQPLERFSEGVKEQLATILRVSIAEHLQGALVLDDHLAQTDPSRTGWFRELLAAAAQRIQVIVLTCRPSEYLGGDDPPAAVGQDMGELIERSLPNLRPADA